MAKFKVGDEVCRIREPNKTLRVVCVGPWRHKEGEPHWYGLCGPKGEGRSIRRCFDAWERDLIAA